MLKVVLTGIPSSGKTSVINSVVERFSEQGYHVLVVPETATEFINSGIAPVGDNALDPLVFQELVLRKQLSKESLYEYAAMHIGNDKTIILFDRGTLDGYAYVKEECMDKVLKGAGVRKRTLLLNYDVVLFLEGKEEYFTKENNKARYEKNAEEAADLRKNLLNSYLGHDNLRVIQPREEMEDKQEEVINIIANMLGKPTRIREQKKFLVSGVLDDVLKNYVGNGHVTITQSYLGNTDDSLEYRIRKIDQGSDSSYHLAVIKKKENGKREILKEKILDEKEYEILLSSKSSDTLTVEKERFTFVYANQYYKLDIFDDGLMLLEVNLTKENPDLTLPEFVTTIEDVTNNPNYTNINIARRKKEDYDKGKNNSCRGNRLLR
ncbi:MAG: AAA family ATPase [Bacilli bacterium]|nr:AAA family ATPase [Bacilli bacterium]